MKPISTLKEEFGQDINDKIDLKVKKNKLWDIENNNYKLLDIQDLLDIEEININEEDLFKIKNGQVLNKITDKYILFKYNNENIALYQKYNNKQIKPLIMF